MILDSEGNRIGLRTPAPRAAEGPLENRMMQAPLGAARPQAAFLSWRGPARDVPASGPLRWEHARHMITLMRDGRPGT